MIECTAGTEHTFWEVRAEQINNCTESAVVREIAQRIQRRSIPPKDIVVLGLPLFRSGVLRVKEVSLELLLRTSAKGEIRWH